MISSPLCQAVRKLSPVATSSARFVSVAVICVR
jgi:hypothetical protein